MKTQYAILRHFLNILNVGELGLFVMKQVAVQPLTSFIPYIHQILWNS